MKIEEDKGLMEKNKNEKEKKNETETKQKEDLRKKIKDKILKCDKE
jgi:hypothetical protein